MKRTYSIAGFAALCGLMLLSACGTPVTPASVATVAADTTTLVADIQAATNGTPLTSAETQTIATQVAKLQADVTALNAGTAGTTTATVLGDVATAISEIGPFVPVVEALLASAATPNAAPPSPIQTKLQLDYQKLHTDAALASLPTT